MKKDSVQKQWDTAVEPWVDFVCTRKDYFRDEMNNPAMLELFGDIRGKRILDLGCGEGDNSRIMARNGAKVTGVDFSKKMIDFAIQQEKNEGFGIDYYVLNASNLHTFKENAFDIVICFMALQDIEDYQDAIKEAYRVLRKCGRFASSIPHPCFEVKSQSTLSSGQHVRLDQFAASRFPLLFLSQFFALHLVYASTCKVNPQLHVS